VKFRPYILIVIASITVLLCAVIPAFAQPTAPVRLPGGLFGGSDDRRARHKLDFSLSLVEANDSDTPAEFRGIVPTDTVLSGYSTMLGANADYGWKGSRVQVRATGASVLRYYGDLESVSTVSYSAGVGVSARLGGRTTIVANQTAAYSPSYLYGLFPREAVGHPGDAAPAAPDYAVTDTESYSYGTTVTLTHGLSRRSRLSATGDFEYTDFLHQTATFPDLHSGGFRGEYSRNLSRNVAARAGYRYREGTFGYGSALGLAADLSTTEHGPDVGVSYTRPLSGTRRLALGFNVGASALSAPGLDTGGLYHPYTELTVDWQFDRAWQVRGTTRRALEYVAGLRVPVFVNGVAAELTGLIHPRLNVVASAKTRAISCGSISPVNAIRRTSGSFSRPLV